MSKPLDARARYKDMADSFHAAQRAKNQARDILHDNAIPASREGKYGVVVPVDASTSRMADMLDLLRGSTLKAVEALSDVAAEVNIGFYAHPASEDQPARVVFYWGDGDVNPADFFPRVGGK